MRFGLCFLVGCMLLVPGSNAEDGKTAMPSHGTASPRAVNDPQPVDPGSPNDRRKNRYISFKPNNITGETVTLEVTLTGSLPHPGLVGSSWWVQPPVPPGSPLLTAGECVALLGPQATAADIDWVAAGCEILHVTGCPIEPTSDYDVRAVAGADVSGPLAVSTILKPGVSFWGDSVGSFDGTEWTAPNGFANKDDIIVVIKTWQGGPVVAPVPGVPVAHLSVADLAPGNIDLVVNYDDVLQSIRAFQSFMYPYGPAGPDGACPDEPDVDGQDAEIRIVPIRLAPLGSPTGTFGNPVNATFNAALGCWEVLIVAGVEVDLDLQAMGWGAAVGSPTLAAIQATVLSDGYANGVGGNLNPKGWPSQPEKGVYQATKTCGAGGDGSPCVEPFDQTCDNSNNGFCIPNPDWIMPVCANDIWATATSTMDYGWATAVLSDCADDDTLVKTIGSLILEVPEDAAGTYLIDLNPDPNSTFMTTGSGASITGITLTPACITIVDIEPPIRAPAPHNILKNRYISIDPRGASGTNPDALHIRVMVDSTQVNGLSGSGPWWATDPVNGAAAVCISIVSATKPASEPDWSGCPVVHLTGCPIVPSTNYAIAVESGGDLSANVLLSTQAKPGVKWHSDCVGTFDGTVWSPPNGVVSFEDVLAAIKTFVNPNAFNATHLSVTDVHPNLNGAQMNLTVNISDVFVIILGFMGQEYPGPDLTQCP